MPVGRPLLSLQLTSEEKETLERRSEGHVSIDARHSYSPFVARASIPFRCPEDIRAEQLSQIIGDMASLASPGECETAVARHQVTRDWRCVIHVPRPGEGRY